MEPETVKAFIWAVQQEDPIEEGTLKGWHDEWIAHSQAMYRAWALKANKGEAATRIRQAGSGNGLEAWRLLMHVYEPKSRGRQREG